jgi:capsid assembly protease
MTIANILNDVWAIQPSYLEMIRDIYQERKEQRLDAQGLRELEAAVGRPLNNNADRRYEVRDGVAIIPMLGSMVKRGGMFSDVSGLTSYEAIQRDLAQAENDPEVIAAVLNIDSPGGVVNGCATTGAAIRKFGGKKPIGAWTDGSMTSAAYWAGAATGNVYIGSDTTELGSIGVVGGHTDISKAEEMTGKKTTILTAGKYKGVGHPFGALSPEHQAVMQDRLDYSYTVFVDTIAEYRGVPVETVLSDMADGRVFSGRQAIDAGLADGLVSFDGMIAMMREKGIASNKLGMPVKGMSSQTATGGKASAEKQQEVMRMTKAELKEQYPALYAEIFSEGQQAGTISGAETERTRIQSVLSLPGAGAVAHKDLIRALAFDGKTTAEAAAYQLVMAEEQVRTNMAAAIPAAAVKPAPAAEEGHESKEEKVLASSIDQMVAGASAYQSRQ